MSATDLLARLGQSDIAVLEVSAAQNDRGYREGHIPGARWAHWKTLLWDPRRREFAEADVLAHRLGELGIAADQTLVLVGDPLQFATYALWVLSAAGQQHVRFLDGGKEHWALIDGPLTDGPTTSVARGPRTAGRADPTTAVGRDAVLRSLETREHQIVDFRSPEEYSGERVSPHDLPGGVDHGAERTGRIPGAVHVYYRDLLNEDWTLRSRAEILDVFATAGVDPTQKIIGYCRLSHRATLGWFALTEVVGAHFVQVYDGSWTEWGSIVGVPIET
jgi:thiosulfate/3-mercaptopyruvate sulfurtransferase